MGLEKIHRRRADKTGHKLVDRVIVKYCRSRCLLNDALFHDDDSRSQRHGLGLVMGHIDDRGSQSLMEFRDLHPHLHPEFGIQVGKRLVHEKNSRLTDHGASNRHSLALSSGKFSGPSVQKMLDLQDSCHLVDSFIDLFFRNLPDFQRVGHISVHSHMGIEGIVLKNHSHLPLLRFHIVHQLSVHPELAAGDLLQPGDHPERCGLTAA